MESDISHGHRDSSPLPLVKTVGGLTLALLMAVGIGIIFRILTPLPVVAPKLYRVAIPQTSLVLEKVQEPPGTPPMLSRSRHERTFLPLILSAAQRHNVDPDMVRAIIMAESSYNPRAVSKKGAAGLMQLMPQTAKSLGVTDIFNPAYNIDAGVRYFRNLLNHFDNNAVLALAAYNAGSRKVRQYQGVPPYKATRYYVKRVFEYYSIYKKEGDRVTNRI